MPDGIKPEAMTLVMVVTIITVIMIIILNAVRYKEMEFDRIFLLIDCIKIFGYGSLTIYIYMLKKDSTIIPLLDFFTYMLACFETGSIFVNSIGKLISRILGEIFSKE